jgi:hypothetical protein
MTIGFELPQRECDWGHTFLLSPEEKSEALTPRRGYGRRCAGISTFLPGPRCRRSEDQRHVHSADNRPAACRLVTGGDLRRLISCGAGSARSPLRSRRSALHLPAPHAGERPRSGGREDAASWAGEVLRQSKVYPRPLVFRLSASFFLILPCRTPSSSHISRRAR